MVTLTGTFTRLDGTPATGTVRVTPSRTPIMDPDGGVIISGPQTFPLDSEGKISVLLPATDDPSLGEAFTYSVITNMSHANWQIRGLELPSSMSTVDLSNPPSGVIREYPTRAEWEAIIDPVVAGAEVAANRAEDAADSAWEAVDTPGRQGPPGEVTTAALTAALAGKVTGTGMTLRHDTTVGERVLLDHPGGTTMLHGDTGIRDVSSLLANGWKAGSMPLRLRRVGQTITLEGRLNGTEATSSAFLSLPTGFGFIGGSFTITGVLRGGDLIMRVGGTLETSLRLANLDIMHSWNATPAWPTTLPGLPS